MAVGVKPSSTGMGQKCWMAVVEDSIYYNIQQTM